MNRIGNPLRAFFLTSALVSWIGLWLTGFNIAHWLLYIAPIAFLIAGATGYCPGMTITTRLFGKTEVAKVEE